MSEGSVQLEVADGIAWVRIDRPDKLNALAGTMREQLRDRIGEAAGEARALVVTGAGRAFCAGGDVGTMDRIVQQENWSEFRRILHAGAECVLSLQAFPGLTIAAVNGVAAGAGLGLALACDLRIGVRDTVLAASWSKVGLAPDWAASYWLPRLLGYARAVDLVLGAKKLGADEAVAAGLLHEVVPDRRLRERAEELVRERGENPEAVARVRSLLRKGLEGGLEASLAAETELQEELIEEDAVAERLRAFVRERQADSDRGD